MSTLRTLCSLFMAIAGVHGASTPWLARTEALLSPAERKAYVSMTPAEQKQFEQNIWDSKRISARNYFERAAYVDETFGSGKPGSGANTDQGRVYLSLGAPNRVTRLASSRAFFPVEIWSYSEAPGLNLHYELQLLFFRPRGTGEYRLYSQTLNTVRDLMNPQSSTRGLFGMNDVITEGDLRTKLNLSPAEDEIIAAATGVARGITGLGNDEILALVSTPSRALSKELKPSISSRFIATKPELTVFETRGTEGVPCIDVSVTLAVRERIQVELLAGDITLTRQETNLKGGQTTEFLYEHRFDLLPGSYRLLLTVDGRPYIYPLNVAEPAALSKILIGDISTDSHANTPFEFDDQHINPNPNGRVAVVQPARSGTVEWALRRGAQTVWRARSEAGPVAILNIKAEGLAPGDYVLQASTGSDTQEAVVRVVASPAAATVPVLSQNANLGVGERQRFIAHQWLTRGNAAEARRWLIQAHAVQPSPAHLVELAKIDALTGRYDEARDKLKTVLASDSRNFEAITTMAYVEAQLQDYRVAADLYRRALSIQPSPVIEQALAALPRTR